jgi:uncharacterized protein
VILLDVNVALAAHRNDHPHHESVRPWFDWLTAGDEQFGVPDVVWSAFVRSATNTRIFEVPTPIDDAFAFLRAVRAQPNHVTVVPGEAHLAIFEDVCRRFDATGDLVPDAYLVAIAMEVGASIASFDRDFARFDDLDWIIPDAAG